MANTTVVTRHTNLRTLVNEADPERELEIQRHVEYRFSNGRQFIGKVDERGAYAPEE